MNRMLVDQIALSNNTQVGKKVTINQQMKGSKKHTTIVIKYEK